jgi:hypothetical protein
MLFAAFSDRQYATHEPYTMGVCIVLITLVHKRQRTVEVMLSPESCTRCLEFVLAQRSKGCRKPNGVPALEHVLNHVVYC